MNLHALSNFSINSGTITGTCKNTNMKYFTIAMLLALPFVLPGQITNFKKIKKFGLEWVQKTQTIKQGQTVLLNENTFVSEVKGAAKIKRVGPITEVTPTSTEPLILIWCSLLKKKTESKEKLFDKK